jgi:hypothetical protein
MRELILTGNFMVRTPQPIGDIALDEIDDLNVPGNPFFVERGWHLENSFSVLLLPL